MYVYYNIAHNVHVLASTHYMNSQNWLNVCIVFNMCVNISILTYLILFMHSKWS